MAKGLAERKARLQRAVKELRAEIRGVPPALGGASLGALPLQGDVESVRAKWQAWAEAPAKDPLALADHAEQHAVELSDAVGVLQAKARELREQLAEAWAPVAEAQGSWLESAWAAAPTRPKVGG